jgi:hypothetical protein
MYIVAATPMFLAGLRSIGKCSLQGLLCSIGFSDLERVCERELAAINSKSVGQE